MRDVRVSGGAHTNSLGHHQVFVVHDHAYQRNAVLLALLWARLCGMYGQWQACVWAVENGQGHPVIRPANLVHGHATWCMGKKHVWAGKPCVWGGAAGEWAGAPCVWAGKACVKAGKPGAWAWKAGLWAMRLCEGAGKAGEWAGKACVCGVCRTAGPAGMQST